MSCNNIFYKKAIPSLSWGSECGLYNREQKRKKWGITKCVRYIPLQIGALRYSLTHRNLMILTYWNMLTISHMDSCGSFVWWVLSFDFAIWLENFRFEFYSEFSIFVILLFTPWNLLTFSYTLELGYIVLRWNYMICWLHLGTQWHSFTPRNVQIMTELNLLYSSLMFAKCSNVCISYKSGISGLPCIALCEKNNWTLL